MAYCWVLLGLCAAVTLQSASSAGIDPVGLWPMNSRFGLKDVVGGKDGVGSGVSLDESQPVDLEAAADSLPSKLQGVYEDKSYRFTGAANSLVTIPNIAMPNDFTIVTFIKPEKDGPIFTWDAPGVWADHFWIVNIGYYALFFRPMGMSNRFGTAVWSGMTMNTWNMVAFSYQKSTGRGTMFINNKKVIDQSNLLPGNTAHNTQGSIKMGRNAFDGRFFRGGISCASLFDKFVTSMDEINWGPIADKCFKKGSAPATCYCWGDPHCLSFDGIWNHFQGACKYTMARDGCEDGAPNAKPSFEVITNNNRWWIGAPVSLVREVTVKFHAKNLIIEMYQNRHVYINGDELLGSPANPKEGVTITRTATKVYVTLEGVITIVWDGIYTVSVLVSGDYREKVCGVCGNANRDPADDWTIGDSDLCMDQYPGAVTGQLTTNVNIFGNSWMASHDSSEAVCQAECPNIPEEPLCTDAATNKAKEHCKILQDTNGPFKECLKYMDATQKEELFNNCVFDSCMLQEYDTTVCQHAGSTAMICQDAYDETVVWRKTDFCPLKCGANMEYKPCGSQCMPTCSDPKGTGCGVIDKCEEGCFCKEGWIWDGVDSCIAHEQCGCEDDEMGVFVPVGISFLREKCSKQCSCDEAQGDLQCVSYGCGENEECTVNNDGKQLCDCPDPFIEEDGECKEMCDLKADSGTGKKSLSKWYFNANKGKCTTFDYKGQGGNGNRFNSQQACKEACFFPRLPAHCLLDKDAGSGSARKTMRYYYNKKMDVCKKFKYLGEGGNENNFDSKADCSAACKRLA